MHQRKFRKAHGKFLTQFQVSNSYTTQTKDPLGGFMPPLVLPHHIKDPLGGFMPP